LSNIPELKASISSEDASNSKPARASRVGRIGAEGVIRRHIELSSRLRNLASGQYGNDDDPHRLTQDGGLRLRLNPPYELFTTYYALLVCRRSKRHGRVVSGRRD